MQQLRLAGGQINRHLSNGCQLSKGHCGRQLAAAPAAEGGRCWAVQQHWLPAETFAVF